MKKARCLETSDFFFLTEGRVYFIKFEYRNSDGDEYVLVTNDVGREITVLANRFVEL